MSDDTLSHEAFAHYLAQDVLYIEQDSRAFTITAGRANTNDAFSFLHPAFDVLIFKLISP